jgi:hypothetical protein
VCETTDDSVAAPDREPAPEALSDGASTVALALCETDADGDGDGGSDADTAAERDAGSEGGGVLEADVEAVEEDERGGDGDALVDSESKSDGVEDGNGEADGNALELREADSICDDDGAADADANVDTDAGSEPAGVAEVDAELVEEDEWSGEGDKPTVSELSKEIVDSGLVEADGDVLMLSGGDELGDEDGDASMLDDKFDVDDGALHVASGESLPVSEFVVVADGEPDTDAATDGGSEAAAEADALTVDGALVVELTLIVDVGVPETDGVSVAAAEELGQKVALGLRVAAAEK